MALLSQVGLQQTIPSESQWYLGRNKTGTLALLSQVGLQQTIPSESQWYLGRNKTGTLALLSQVGLQQTFSVHPNGTWEEISLGL